MTIRAFLVAISLAVASVATGPRLSAQDRVVVLAPDAVFDGQSLHRDWQVVVPSFGIIQGPFQIASLETGGRHDGEVTFELSLASAGLLAFTAL